MKDILIPKWQDAMVCILLNKELTISEVASTIGTTFSSAHAIVHVLKKKDFVDLGNSDARTKKKLSLTFKGSKVAIGLINTGLFDGKTKETQIE